MSIDYIGLVCLGMSYVGLWIGTIIIMILNRKR